MGKTGKRQSQTGATELEFALSDPTYPFVNASRAERCRFELEEMIPRGDGRYAEFFSVSDADPDRFLSLVGPDDPIETHLVERYENGGLVEFSVSDSCPAVSLAELGALPRVVESVNGDGRIVAKLPARHEATEVVESFLDDHPEAEFVAKREKAAPVSLFGREEFRRTVREHLTDRQREVLETAYEAGYYDWPRDCTGQEVAAELGITSATFSQHVHVAERKLLAVLFEGPSAETGASEVRRRG